MILFAHLFGTNHYDVLCIFQVVFLHKDDFSLYNSFQKRRLQCKKPAAAAAGFMFGIRTKKHPRLSGWIWGSLFVFLSPLSVYACDESLCVERVERCFLGN